MVCFLSQGHSVLRRSITSNNLPKASSFSSRVCFCSIIDAKIKKKRDEIVAELKEKAGCVGFDEIVILENKAADLNEILDSVRYYLNSKVIILTNKVGKEVTETYELEGETVTRTYVKIDENYRKYFFDTMLPYIMQVIPSTAILVLKDFN